MLASRKPETCMMGMFRMPSDEDDDTVCARGSRTTDGRMVLSTVPITSVRIRSRGLNNLKIFIEEGQS